MAPSPYATPYATSPKKEEEEKDIHKSDFYVGDQYPPENKRVSITVWLPPGDAHYITKTGRWVFGVPVWDQSSARKAITNFKQTMEETVYDDKFTGTINLEKLFLLADALVPALELMKQLNEIL